MSEPSSMDFAERVVEQAGIMVVPSALYGFGDRHIRIGFGRQIVHRRRWSGWTCS